MSGQYDDIILPHPDSSKHPRMSLYDRAAQFSPFAALTGHHAAIAETGRLTDQRMELDEYEMARVDAALQRLQELLPGEAHGVHHLLCARRTEERRQLPNCHRRSSGSTRSTGMIQMTDRQCIPISDVFSIEIIP